MKPNLVPSEPLSQVAFIFDYIQLRFQDEAFNLFNGLRLSSAASVLEQGAPGFTDGLVALIGSKVSDIPQGRESLTLVFENGSVLEVLKEKVSGPEAFSFHGPNNFMLVEQNA